MSVPFLDFIHNPGSTQPWRWRVVASNGKILCHSETYVKWVSCANGAKVALHLSDHPQPWHAVALTNHKTVVPERAYNVRHIVEGV